MTMDDVTVYMTVSEYWVHRVDGESEATDPKVIADEESSVALRSLVTMIQDDVSTHVLNAEYKFRGLNVSDVRWADIEVRPSDTVRLTQDGAIEGYRESGVTTVPGIGDLVDAVQCREILVDVACADRGQADLVARMLSALFPGRL